MSSTKMKSVSVSKMPLRLCCRRLDSSSCPDVAGFVRNSGPVLPANAAWPGRCARSAAAEKQAGDRFAIHHDGQLQQAAQVVAMHSGVVSGSPPARPGRCLPAQALPFCRRGEVAGWRKQASLVNEGAKVLHGRTACSCRLSGEHKCPGLEFRKRRADCSRPVTIAADRRRRSGLAPGHARFRGAARHSLRSAMSTAEATRTGCPK